MTPLGFQSTHPRGVRQHKIIRTETINNFNPRTREGCDICYNLHKEMINVFQSTHPRGVRLSVFVVFKNIELFQSTHPRGVRLQPFINNLTALEISIHAPARGATVFFSHYLLLKNTANHFLKSFISFFPHFL